MNPFVWRFIGGVSTSMAIDAMIPDYYKHTAHGVNLAIWGQGTLKGRGSEAVGRGVSKAGKAGVKVGKYGARSVIKHGPKLMVKAGSRFVPIVGWGLLTYDIVSFMVKNPDFVESMAEEHREITSQGPYYIGRGISRS